MIIFQDRREAGQQLAKKLSSFRDASNVVVIGLPRGGVVTAGVLASELHLPLDIQAPRKIGAPDNPELALGAISSDGAVYLNHQLIKMLNVPSEYVQRIIDQEQAESIRRMQTYRCGRKPLNVKGKTVIVVDDGIATGATMRAGVMSLQALGAKTIIIAVPVAPYHVINQLKSIVHQIIVFDVPEDFGGIGQFYKNFDQVTDAEVIAIMTSAKNDSV